MKVAVISVVPIATPVARPVAAIVATAGMLESQVAVVVTFNVVLSDRLAVAMKSNVTPLAIMPASGVTATLVTVASVTIAVVSPVIAPTLALIVALPLPVVSR